MGCVESKLYTVKRCMERRRLLEAAKDAMVELANAHADYISYLRLTGSALTSFALGVPSPISGTETGTVTAVLEEREREEVADADSTSGMVVRDLKDVVDALKVKFDMAASTGDKVSKMLESKKCVCAESTLDERSLCDTLDYLLAWEKTLYEVVTKASTKRERLEIERKVTSQTVSTTSTAINNDLVPQLVKLCHEFMYMWSSMHEYHKVQSNYVQQVQGIVSRSAEGDSTCEILPHATRDLDSALTNWRSSFVRVIKFQREFIRSLHGWFKLTIFSINFSEVSVFCDEWEVALDRVPDLATSEAIKSFINVVHLISGKVEVTRAVTLNNLQTGLVGLFSAMTCFSALFTEALEAACNRSLAAHFYSFH